MVPVRPTARVGPMNAGRLRTFRPEIVTTVVVVVLAVVAIVALWPRSSTPSATGAAPAATGGQPAGDADLAPLRTAAALQSCPAGTGAGSGPLAGVTVPCLGAAGSVDLGAALAGRTTLLNVWASWCEPCRTELPVLAEYAARPGAVPVVGIDVRDDPRSALRLLAGIGVRLPSVTDPDDALRSALALPPALPVSYLVRADGSVTMVDPPVPFRSADDVAAAVARLAPGAAR